MPKLEYVTGASWPRSGFHMMQRMLQSYFGERMTFSLDYQKKVYGIRKGACCDVELCNYRGAVTYCKNHDNKGVVPIEPGHRYLVQYRDFLPAIISTFEKGVAWRDKPDTVERFKSLVERRVGKYNEFIDKWVLGPDGQARILRVKYEDLVSDPRKWLEEAILLFSPNEDIDAARIDQIVSETPKVTFVNGERLNNQTAGVKSPRKVEDFRFYDPEWFAELAEMTRVDGRRKERAAV